MDYVPRVASTVACKTCGALNEPDFGQCIRCGGPLGDAEVADKAKRRVAAPRRRSMQRGPGAEPLFGRWPASLLPATKILLFMNMLIFTLQGMNAAARTGDIDGFLSGGHPLLDAFLYGAYVPHEALAVEGFGYVIGGMPGLYAEPWRLLSACFVHFGIVHIIMNMVGLLDLGRIMEPAIGSVRFIIAYVLSGILGFAATMVWVLIFPEVQITAGASGAIFGMLGMMLGFMWRRGDPRWKELAVRSFVYAVLFAFIMPINNSAHAGGAIAGAVFGALYAPGAPKPSLTWQRTLAMLLLVASLGSVMAARLSPVHAKIIELEREKAQAIPSEPSER